MSTAKEKSTRRNMAIKLEFGTAIDIGSNPRVGRYYLMTEDQLKVDDFLDLSALEWVRTVARLKTGTGFPDPANRDNTIHVPMGALIASTSYDLKNIAGMEIVWER